MIIDSHTHLLPDRLARAIRSFFLDHGHTDLAYKLDNRRVLSRLFDEGIEAVWNLPYAHRSNIAAKLNRDMVHLADELADQPVEIITGCTVHPDDPDPAQDLVTAIEDGARVLKLHCSVGSYQPDDPRLTPVLDAAAESDIPIVVHAGHAISGSTAANELVPIGTIAQRHPGATIILAHFGHHAFAEAVNLLHNHSNLYADLTPVILDPVPLTKSIGEGLRDRILFGSDTPNTGQSVSQLRDGLEQLDLNPEVLAAIMGGTAERLAPTHALS